MYGKREGLIQVEEGSGDNHCVWGNYLFSKSVLI